MSLRKLFDDEFDLKKAKECLDVYSKCTGVESSIIDSTGEVIYRASCNNEGGFCANVHQMLCNPDICRDSHLYGSYQAERFGGKYIFFCPMGFTHWVSPLHSDSITRCSLMGGPVLMVDPNEFLIDEIIERNIKDKSVLSELKEHLKDIPVVKPDKVTSLSDLLYIVAEHASDSVSLKYKEATDYNRQQSDISQYIHDIKNMSGDRRPVESYPIEKEKDLLKHISIGDKKSAQKILNEILGHIFFSSGMDFEVIKSRTLELVVLLSRAALEGGADNEEVFGLNCHYINQIFSFKTVEEISFWLSKILTRFTDCVFNLANVKHADIIYKAIEYINKNYMSKITLEDVASYVHLSPPYFSKLFKDETRKNFNVYLNNVRIEMGKKLLLDESIPLVDVSILIGFEDQSYFSRVFKKITGVTPGKFRKSRGQVI
ncbi:MAG TPA: helix-turn-helix domain-containing protein [Clostridiaceae bacterium]|jgi:two-component system response regulator YesN|nr:helix-turn-helix domain-containing protein [Clostridiaceae bacterium]